MKALEILKILNKYYTGKFAIKINEAIEELEDIKKDIVRLKEYKQLLHNYNIETYRCKCGALGRVGYLCSNKECSEV